MSYERLTPIQKIHVDYVMQAGFGYLGYMVDISRERSRSLSITKHHMTSIFKKYGITREQFIPVVRLVYLRAKELGLIQ